MYAVFFFQVPVCVRLWQKNKSGHYNLSTSFPDVILIKSFVILIKSFVILIKSFVILNAVKNLLL